jgi:hypothetical protein
VFAYAAAEGLTVRLDGTEIQVRRPRANQPGRRAFVSGKKKQNTIKATLALRRARTPDLGRSGALVALDRAPIRRLRPILVEDVDGLGSACPTGQGDRGGAQQGRRGQRHPQSPRADGE